MIAQTFFVALVFYASVADVNSQPVAPAPVVPLPKKEDTTYKTEKSPPVVKFEEKKVVDKEVETVIIPAESYNFTVPKKPILVSSVSFPKKKITYFTTKITEVFIPEKEVDTVVPQKPETWYVEKPEQKYKYVKQEYKTEEVPVEVAEPCYAGEPQPYSKGYGLPAYKYG